MKTLLEVREYNFEGRIQLRVELDRKNKKMSFVQYDITTKTYKPMTFLFAGREKQYMNAWTNILGAMQYCIKEAKEVMQGWDDEATDELIRVMMELDAADDKA